MNFIERFNLFLFDMDGVIYIGNKPVAGSVEAVNHLIKANKKVVFLTNNPARSLTDYKTKFKQMGIRTQNVIIITSTNNMCYYLLNKIGNLRRRTAFVIGSRQFKASISKTGIKTVKPGKDYRADYVIMGGHRDFNFNEIDHACQFIRNGAKLLATNRDSNYPSDIGFSPGTGALLSSIEIASGKNAGITGKPEKYIFELSQQLSGIKNKKKTVIIGDNLDTDILGGNNFGITTVLSLSGVTDRKKLKLSKIRPDHVIKDLTYLVKL